MGSNRSFTDPHLILGLPATATKDDVKAAFRRLALKVHPDVDPSPQAAARFAEVKQAADIILKRDQAPSLGSSPSRAAAAAYTASDWRPRSRHTAVWFCAATLACGCAIFYGALVSHQWLGGYRWQTPAQVEGRLHHPTPRRQQLLQLMMQERHQQGQQNQRDVARTHS